MWRPLTPNGDVRWLKYSWGPATANSLAVRLRDRGWLVVSAPVGVAPDAADELASDGGVIALLAPNAYHYLGQREWRRRFPSATSWAPRSAQPRLRSKCSDISFRAAEELSAELPLDLHLVIPDGQKTTDLLMRIETASDVVWWLGDLFSNTSSADAIWPLRLLSRLVGSGPGYRRNTKPGLVYVRDSAAWLSSVRHALTAHPPTRVVPAHGDPVTEDTASKTAALLK
jgi:glyoxylase-like metal-dependent hydrolase (beta-lactamase superfamily II)